MTGNSVLNRIHGGLRRLVPRFIRDRYLAKFIVIVLVVVLIMAGIGYVGYGQAVDTVEQDTENQLQSTATMQADSIGSWVEERSHQARMISNTEELGTGDDEVIQRYLDRHWEDFNVRGVHYVDSAERQILASSHGTAIGESLDDIDDPWATEETFDGFERPSDVDVSDHAFEDTLFRDDVIAFTTPVFGSNTKHVVIIADIENHVEALHQPMGDGDGEDGSVTTTILNRDGGTVLTGDEDEEQQHEDAFAQLREDDTPVYYGEEQVYVSAPVPNSDGWTAVTSVPKEQAFEVSDTVVQSIGAIVGVSLVALLGATVVLGRHTVVPLTRLRSKVKQMEEGNLEVDLQTGRTDEIGQLYGGFATMRDSLRQRMIEVDEARQDAEAARDEAERMNRHLEAKADEYNQVIDEWAEGDLTRRLDPTSQNAAMTGIARDLNAMVADLEIALDHVKGFANQTAVASEQVTASTEEVRSASQQVTDSIQEISAGAERQNEKLVAATDEMNNLSATTEEITSLSVQVADLAERTAETGQEGREAAQEAIQAMDEIEAGSENAVEEIRQLEREEVAQIDELIASIAEIAKETNMLALNANIEASRAGGGESGDGEGFGVVAHEIKELAQDAKVAADEIEGRLESIREQTKRSASEVQATSELIEDASARVQRTVDGLEEIAEYAEETNTGVQEISSVTEAQAESTEEIVSQVEEVTTISEETTAEAETVASAAEEQTAALVETSQSIEDLSRRATSLSDALDRFETDVSSEFDPADDDELEVL